MNCIISDLQSILLFRYIKGGEAANVVSGYAEYSCKGMVSCFSESSIKPLAVSALSEGCRSRVIKLGLKSKLRRAEAR